MQVNKKIIYMFMLSQMLMCSHGLIGKDNSSKKDEIGKEEYVGMFSGKYEGEELNGKAHGKGKVTSVLGDVLEGTFVNDEAKGFFIVKYVDGERFEHCCPIES
mgnify:FL=1